MLEITYELDFGVIGFGLVRKYCMQHMMGICSIYSVEKDVFIASYPIK